MKVKMRITMFAVIFVLLIVYIFTGAVIYNYGKTDEKQSADVIIVLGAAASDDGVSPVYRERINHAIWLYENNYADYIGKRELNP